MYGFRDTAKGSVGSVKLPSEAVFINGVSLDEVVDGYRTLWVSGREPLEMEYETQKIGDNYKMTSWNQNVRTLTVGYQIIGTTAEDVMDVYNILNSHLNFKDARISFNDESNKYFIGSKADSDTPESGLLSFTSSFDIICIDPHKYSTATRQFPATLNSDGILEATIVNNGTADVPISYDITHNADNGYIGIVSAEGAMEFGYIEEADGENYQQSEKLIDTTDFSDWEPYDKNSQDDTKKCNLTMTTETDNNGTMLGTISGTMSTDGTADGGCWRKMLPADSEGVTGAQNFYIWGRSWFETAKMGQTGTCAINAVAADGSLIASYIIEKVDATGNTARLSMVTGDNPKNAKKMISFTPGYWGTANPYTSRQTNGGGPWDLKKVGSKITFFWFGSYFTFDVPSLADKELAWVEYYVGQWKGHGLDRQAVKGLVTGMHLRYLAVTKLNVDKWRDVPNRYAAGDVVTIDGDAKKPYVNGMLAYDDEVVGTQYFKALPGTSKVQFVFSDFSDPLPDVTATIREAWL